MFPVCYSAIQILIPTVILSLSVFLNSWCNAESTLKFITPTDSPWNANEGHVMISWKNSDESGNEIQSVFQLEQGETVGFRSAKIAYHGTDNSTFISGLAGGTYFFRVRSFNDTVKPLPWSDTIQVNVNYASPKLVTILLLVGVVVLIATITAILKGHYRYKA